MLLKLKAKTWNSNLSKPSNSLFLLKLRWMNVWNVFILCIEPYSIQFKYVKLHYRKYFIVSFECSIAVLTNAYHMHLNVKITTNCILFDMNDVKHTPLAHDYHKTKQNETEKCNDTMSKVLLPILKLDVVSFLRVYISFWFISSSLQIKKR